MNEARGDRLRELRNKKKMTQDRLAEHLGFQSRTPITDMEFGKEFQTDILLKLCDLYDVEPNYILLYDRELDTNNGSQSAIVTKEINIKKAAHDISYWITLSLLLLLIPAIAYLFDRSLSAKLALALGIAFYIGIISIISDYRLKTKKNTLIIHVPITNFIKYKHLYNEDKYTNSVKEHKHSKIYLTILSGLLYFLSIGIIGITQMADNQTIGLLFVLWALMVYWSIISINQYNKHAEFDYRDLKLPFHSSILCFIFETLIFIISIFVIAQSNITVDWTLVILILLQPAYIGMRLFVTIRDIHFVTKFAVIERSESGVNKRIIKFGVSKKPYVSDKSILK